MTVALIVNNKVHQILLDQPSVPVWPPFPNGQIPLLVQVPDGAEQGWDYDEESGQVTAPREIPPQPSLPEKPGYAAQGYFDEESWEWKVDYVPDPAFAAGVLDGIGGEHE